MKNLPPRLVEDAADANLIASFRAHIEWQEDCPRLDGDGLLAIAGSTRFPGPYRNLVVRLDASLSPAELMRRATAFFAPLERRFSVVARGRYDADLEAHLASSGHELRSESPCLLIDRPVPVRPTDARVRIERLSTLAHVRAAVEVSALAFETLGLPPEEARSMLARAERWLEPAIAGFVAFVDEQPAAMALTLFSAGAAGVYWVATLPAARGRGLGEVCTALATNAGFERGAPVVTLQASPMGLPIYTRMGYRPYDTLRRYREA